MSFYNLGKGIFNTETHLVIAHAVNEETAKMLVDILNVAQKIDDKVKKNQAPYCEKCTAFHFKNEPCG